MTGRVIWFTGLPASGKTTLARALHARLTQIKVASCVLDGDSMRHVLAPHLGYSDGDRAEFMKPWRTLLPSSLTRGSSCWCQPPRTDELTALALANYLCTS